MTFAESNPAVALASDFAPLIAEIPSMDEVGSDGLHITVQGVGFTDEVSRSDLEQISSAASAKLAAHPATTLTVGPPYVDEETIQLGTRDSGALVGVRLAIQDAISDVWGVEKTPERGQAYTPHLTVAYSNGVARISQLEDRMRALGLSDRVYTLPVQAVSLIELNRDQKRYEWRELARVPLTAAGTE
ncbi:2'-5' RNA ligase family protein [Amycolatopsis sp. NPDC003861]